MKKIDILYLSQKDVIAVGLMMKDAISIVEDVLREHGLKEFENPPKPGIHPLSDAFIHAMPGYLPRKKTGGIKWVSGFPSNYQYDLPTIMGLIVLNDVNTGQPMAVMDGGYITNMRTAAVSAVAAKYLANKDAKVLGIVGAGIQGRYHLLSLKEVLDGIEVARVFDIHSQVSQRLIALMGEQVPFRIEVGNSIQEVMEDADVVLTATGHLDERIFKESLVKQGTLVLPVHTRGWEKSVLSKVDKFIVDDWQQFNSFVGGADGYYAPLPDFYAELGAIVVGKKPGRENREERIIDFNVGIAIHDVAMASEVLTLARDKGLGTVLPFMEESLPFA
ncbi:MAG: ornithine cyclodeaminase family protein [Desulfobacterales bacterium]|nr:MAG: ornithine cyclodeaminase family protein [Desulfobacterales bacterium]